MKNLLFPALLMVTTAGAQTRNSSFINSGFTGGEHFTEAFSFCNNTAALASLSRLCTGVFAEQKFMLNELKQCVAAIGLPVQKGGIGLMAARNGLHHLNTTQLGLAYGKQLGKVSMGLQFNYNTISIAGYGNDGAIAVDLGSIWQVSKKLYTGIQLNNVMSGMYSATSEEKPAKLYTVSLCYESTEHSLFTIAIMKEEDKPVMVCAGMQYIIAQKLFTRFTISTVTASPFFSAGWKWKNCRVDITANYHPQLGFTPGLVLQFFGKTKNKSRKEEL